MPTWKQRFEQEASARFQSLIEIEEMRRTIEELKQDRRRAIIESDRLSRKLDAFRRLSEHDADWSRRLQLAEAAEDMDDDGESDGLSSSASRSSSAVSSTANTPLASPRASMDGGSPRARTWSASAIVRDTSHLSLSRTAPMFDGFLVLGVPYGRSVFKADTPLSRWQPGVLFQFPPADSSALNLTELHVQEFVFPNGAPVKRVKRVKRGNGVASGNGEASREEEDGLRAECHTFLLTSEDGPLFGMCLWVPEDVTAPPSPLLMAPVRRKSSAGRRDLGAAPPRAFRMAGEHAQGVGDAEDATEGRLQDPPDFDLKSLALKGGNFDDSGGADGDGTADGGEGGAAGGTLGSGHKTTPSTSSPNRGIMNWFKKKKNTGEVPGRTMTPKSSFFQKNKSRLNSTERRAPDYVQKKERLVLYYAEYRPEKLVEIDEILERYKGNEDRLWTLLAHKYEKSPLDSKYDPPSLLANLQRTASNEVEAVASVDEVAVAVVAGSEGGVGDGGEGGHGGTSEVSITVCVGDEGGTEEQAGGGDTSTATACAMLPELPQSTHPTGAPQSVTAAGDDDILPMPSAKQVEEDGSSDDEEDGEVSSKDDDKGVVGGEGGEGGDGGDAYVTQTLRGYCFLSRYPLYDLHFSVLRRIVKDLEGADSGEGDGKTEDGGDRLEGAVAVGERCQAALQRLRGYRGMEVPQPSDVVSLSTDGVWHVVEGEEEVDKVGKASDGVVVEGKVDAEASDDQATPTGKVEGEVGVKDDTTADAAVTAITTAGSAGTSSVGQLLRYKCPSDLEDFSLRGRSRWTIVALFSLLSVDTILDFLSCLLREQHGAVCCADLPMLYALGTAWIPLLRPLEWQATFIPILPSKMIDILYAPVPFLVGVSCYPYMCEYPDVAFLSVRDDAVFQGSVDGGGDVSVAMGEMDPCSRGRDHAVFQRPLPLPQRDELAEKLRPHAEYLRELRAGEAGQFGRPKAVEMGMPLGPKTVAVVDALVDTMNRYLFDLCGDVRAHCVPNLNLDDEDAIKYNFLKDNFLDRHKTCGLAGIAGKKGRAFLKVFVNTQLFNDYCDRIIDAQPLGV